MNKKPAIVIFTLLIGFCSFAQTTVIDSLKKLLQTTNTPAQRAELLIALLKENESLDASTVLNYGNQLTTLSSSLKDDKLKWKAVYFKIVYYEKVAQLDEAASLGDSAMKVLRTSSLQKELYPMFANTQSFVLTKQNKFKEALSLNFTVLQYAEHINDTLYQMRIKNGIGLIHMEMGQNREAINWFLLSLHTTTNPDYLRKAIPVYSNLAANYNDLHLNDSAFYYIRKSLSLANAAQNFDYLANAYFILAGIYKDEKDFPQTEKAMLQGLSYRRQIGDPFFIVSDLTEIGAFYSQTGQPKKGIQACLAGIDSAKKYKLEEKLPILFNALAQNYKAIGNYPKYAETLEQLIILKDSVYKRNSAEALAELNAKYEVQKKENTIIQQQFALTKKNYLLRGSLVLLLLAITAAVVILQQYRKKQKLRLQLIREDEQRKSEKAVILAEEAERKRIAADLHDSLGAYAASIASNIDQLKFTSAEPSDQSVLLELRNNSLSIVSQLGDTIWALKKDALSLTAISDRTKLFIQRIQPSYAAITIDVIEEIDTDCLLSPSHAFHLFQIVKEAINNALRHSRCRQVTVLIKSKQRWEIQISDDGRGMLHEVTIIEDGNGLFNMRSRAKESGWNIEWHANNPKGTSVIIQSAAS